MNEIVVKTWRAPQNTLRFQPDKDEVMVSMHGPMGGMLAFMFVSRIDLIAALRTIEGGSMLPAVRS